MKILPVVCIAIGLASASIANAKSLYKCHVFYDKHGQQKSKVVERYVEPTSASKLPLQLVNSVVYEADGKTPYRIVKVKECTQYHSPFIDVKAQQDDDKPK